MSKDGISEKVRVKVGEREAFNVLKGLYSPDRLCISDKPDIRRFGEDLTTIVEGIEVISTSLMEKFKIARYANGLDIEGAYHNATGVGVYSMDRLKELMKEGYELLNVDNKFASHGINLGQAGFDAFWGIAGEARKYLRGEELQRYDETIREWVSILLNGAITKYVLDACNEKIKLWHSGGYVDCQNKSVAVVITEALSDIDKQPVWMGFRSTDSLARHLSDKLAEVCVANDLFRVYLVTYEFSTDPETSHQWRSVLYVYSSEGLSKDNLVRTGWSNISSKG